MLGYEHDEFFRMYERWRQLVHPDDSEVFEKTIQSAIEEHSPFSIEYRYKAKNGQWQWILCRGKVVESDSEGNAVRVAGFSADITERKQAEEELRASAEQYRVMSSTSMDGFVVVDLAGRIVDANEA